MGPERTRKLLSAERESLICRSLTAGVRTIAELSNELQVSEATVRRDLETLEKQGVIRRVYPMVTEEQLRLWHWMAAYYMCTVGEVMRSEPGRAARITSPTVHM